MKRKLQLLGLFAVLMLTALSQLSAQVITMLTTKKVGERIDLAIVGEGDITIEGVKEAFKPSSSSQDRKWYTLTSQTINIRGKVTELSCFNSKISYLDVSSCRALTKLNCSYNQLSSLDVSNCRALTELDCSDNQLSSLDVSKNTALRYLVCRRTQLSSLDVSKNTALRFLACSDNQLSSLDISNMMVLRYLEVSAGELKVSNCNVLEHLEAYSEELLEISDCNALEYFLSGSKKLRQSKVSRCNALTRVSFSGCEALRQLELSDCNALSNLICNITQLSRLDMSGCPALEELDCSSSRLTELKGLTSKKLRRVECWNNRLNATAMWRLINDLNDEGGDKILKVLEDRDGNGEANQLTKKQIYKAKSKGWRLSYSHLGDKGRVEANADEVPDPTAIEGLDGAEALACYPNPATDFVSLKGLEPQAEVEVYSMAGACVLRGKADASGSLDLDVRQLAEGLYLVKAASRTMKLEVKH